jgi:uncharacterized protein (DUF983 family)
MTGASDPHPARATSKASPRAVTLFARAVRRRCPNCGSGGLFSAWFRMLERCPRCHIRTERGEDGYVVGAYMFNIIAAELLWAALVGSVAVATWPEPPWTMLLYGGGVLMLVLPCLFYPFSKTVFLAFDLLFRPAGDDRP